MIDEPVPGSALADYVQFERQAHLDLEEARANLVRTDRHYQRATSLRGKAAGHVKWVSELLGYVEATVRAETAADALRAARTGQPPVPEIDDHLDPDLPVTLEQAKDRYETAFAWYQRVREQHDEEHQRARAAWAAALRTWSNFLVADRATANGVGSAAGEFDNQAAGVAELDAPRCPDHPAIVLNPPTSRDPGWCVICRRRRQLPEDATRVTFPRTSRIPEEQ